MFRGIEIPDTISISDGDLAILEHSSRTVGETGKQSVLGGITLAAYWGNIIHEASYSPDFMQGIFNPTCTHLEPIDVVGTITAVEDKFERRAKVSRELGIEEDFTHVFIIKSEIHDHLRAAAGYYDHDPRAIIGAAISLRLTILDMQNVGHFYGYTLDGGVWSTGKLVSAEG